MPVAAAEQRQQLLKPCFLMAGQGLHAAAGVPEGRFPASLSVVSGEWCHL